MTCKQCKEIEGIIKKTHGGTVKFEVCSPQVITQGNTRLCRVSIRPLYDHHWPVSLLNPIQVNMTFIFAKCIRIQ